MRSGRFYHSNHGETLLMKPSQRQPHPIGTCHFVGYNKYPFSLHRPRPNSSRSLPCSVTFQMVHTGEHDGALRQYVDTFGMGAWDSMQIATFMFYSLGAAYKPRDASAYRSRYWHERRCSCLFSSGKKRCLFVERLSRPRTCRVWLTKLLECACIVRRCFWRWYTSCNLSHSCLPYNRTSAWTPGLAFCHGTQSLVATKHFKPQWKNMCQGNCYGTVMR